MGTHTSYFNYSFADLLPSAKRSTLGAKFCGGGKADRTADLLHAASALPAELYPHRKTRIIAGIGLRKSDWSGQMALGQYRESGQRDSCPAPQGASTDGGARPVRATRKGHHDLRHLEAGGDGGFDGGAKVALFHSAPRTADQCS